MVVRCGVRASYDAGLQHFGVQTKAWVVFREAGMYPLLYTCLHSGLLAFLGAALDLDDGEYTKVAMPVCIVDAINGVGNVA